MTNNGHSNSKYFEALFGDLRGFVARNMNEPTGGADAEQAMIALDSISEFGSIFIAGYEWGYADGADLYNSMFGSDA